MDERKSVTKWLGQLAVADIGHYVVINGRGVEKDGVLTAFGQSHANNNLIYITLGKDDQFAIVYDEATITVYSD